jgi:hypothetical protein
MGSFGIFGLLSTMLIGIFAAIPTSTTYKLESYGVGSGGTAGSSSSTYSATGIGGELSSYGASANYKSSNGLISTQQANVPAAPTFTNPASYYNKLHIVINNGGNPTDSTFIIAISTDAFASNFQYVQSDNTIGSTAAVQTYATWGSATGVDIIGLATSTVYTVKVKARHGKFTESAYSSTATTSTISPSLTFDIDVSATDTSTSPPYSTSIGTLLAATVVSATQKVWVSFDTNAAAGGFVFISSQNAGLKSVTAGNNTIAAVTGDLSSLSTGYGMQSATATQTTGGPLTAQSPFNGASNNVGIVGTTLSQIYASAVPITAGRASFFLKAKAATTTPTASDYSDSLTLVAVASF